MSGVERFARGKMSGVERSERGNMLILGVLGMTVVSLCLVVGYSFGGLYFLHNRIQSSADEIALAGARKLNEMDRIGQMNNMVARSRHLVYSSRQALDQINNMGVQPEARKLAQQLLDDARDGANQLEMERSNLITATNAEAREVMRKRFNEIRSAYNVVLPWLRVSDAKLVSVKLGRPVNTHTNVEELRGIAELADKDEQGKKVHMGKSVNYYNQGEARLPEGETGFAFRLSSLPAPAGSDIAPARTILPQAFEESKDDREYFSCATSVELSVNVGTGLGPQAGGTVKVSSSAVSTGGGFVQ